MSGFYFPTCYSLLIQSNVLVFHRRDGKALERFLQDYFDGKLKRYLKSEPSPENNDGPVKVSQHLRLKLQVVKGGCSQTWGRNTATQ